MMVMMEVMMDMEMMMKIIMKMIMMTTTTMTMKHTKDVKRRLTDLSCDRHARH